MQPPDDFDPPIGIAEELEPGLRRIVAPNPSPMTYRGTNTYLLGTEDICVIDPGPQSDVHLKAIMDAIGPGQRLSKIIVTHAHVDHSPLARPLAQAVAHKVPVLAFGPAYEGMSPVMQRLSASGMAGGGEGIDAEFAPDQRVSDGDHLHIGDITLEVLHTPGHIGNHICLAWGDRCFTADHVMGWASSLVSPPDGDLTDFMASCAKLQTRDWRVFYPGHGAPVNDPAARLSWLISHRKNREAEILRALFEGPATARELAQKIYTDVPSALLGAASRNVFAHLIDLTGKGEVIAQGSLSFSAPFEHTSSPR
jgi:glyoxylase-like metal-dependent hydrolase (beta-lactamase superfamily II)